MSLAFGLSSVIILAISGQCNAIAPSCGRRQIKLQQLVTHGYTTNPGEFPWHAAIFMTNGFQKSYICGGTLVNELSIITAAHCVTDPANGLVTSPATLFVQLGKFKLNLYGDTVQEHAVQQVIVCEDFQTKTSKYDLAVLRLATQAKFTDYIQPICMFPQPPGINYNDGSIRGTVVGWGYTQYDALSDALQGTTLPVVSHTKCLDSNPDLFERTLYEGMFCAGFRNGTNVCNGDSGGGMFLNRGGQWYLIGVVSFTAAREANTNLCSTKDYTGFTKISAFQDFIVTNCGLNSGVLQVTESRPGPGQGGKQKYFHATDFGVDGKMNWFQAGDYCRSIGQHLAEIRSGQDQAKVKEIVMRGGMEIDTNGVARQKQYWIGANDLGVNRNFKWQFSGKTITFTHWRQNEPNNNNNNEHCVAVLGNKQAFWIDANCKGKRQVLCEVWK